MTTDAGLRERDIGGLRTARTGERPNAHANLHTILLSIISESALVVRNQHTRQRPTLTTHSPPSFSRSGTTGAIAYRLVPLRDAGALCGRRMPVMQPTASLFSFNTFSFGVFRVMLDSLLEVCAVALRHTNANGQTGCVVADEQPDLRPVSPSCYHLGWVGRPDGG
jgi:hypothetical protein